MKVGDGIRVQEPVVVYHHPQHRNQPFNLQGLEGETIDILLNWQGRAISPNLPVKVKFDGKFQVHLHHHEIELLT